MFNLSFLLLIYFYQRIRVFKRYFNFILSVTPHFRGAKIQAISVILKSFKNDLVSARREDNLSMVVGEQDRFPAVERLSSKQQLSYC